MKHILAILLIASTARAELWQLPGGQVQDLDQRRDWSQKFPGAIKVGWYQPNAQTAPTIVPVAQSNLTPAQAAAWFEAKRAADDAAALAARAAREQTVTQAFLDLKAQLQSELNITVNSPAELRGKMAEVNAAAEAKIQAATSVPQIKGVIKLLFTYIVLVDRREDIKE